MDAAGSIGNDDLQRALESWDELAFLAYDGFNTAGRGLLALSKENTQSGIRASYVTFPEGKPNEESAQLVQAYDPMFEFVVMYQEPAGNFRTLRVRTAPDGRNPKRVWFFETLRRLKEEPENAPSVIPEWFWEFLDKVAAKNREHDV